MRRRATLLLTVIVGIVAVATLASTISNKPIGVPDTLAKPTKPPTSLIDGASNPQRIPDRVAYSLVFTMIASHRTEPEQNRIRAYIRQMGLSDADSSALIAAAQEYALRVGVTDNQANTIIMRYHPAHPPLSSEDKNYLEKLNKQRKSIVNDVAASLSQRLSADGFVKVRQHINERVKRKTKITSDEELE